MCRRLRAKGYQILHVDRSMTGHDLAMTRFAPVLETCHPCRLRIRGSLRTVSRFRSAVLGRRSRAQSSPRARMLIRFDPGRLAVSRCVLRSVLPVAALLLFFALLTVRTAYKARWKSRDVATLLGYGVHSHFQQIPIYSGQLQYPARPQTRPQSRADRVQAGLAMKSLLLALLAPFARLALVLDPLRRVWAHARLSARLRNPVHSSVVVHGTPETSRHRKHSVWAATFSFTATSIWKRRTLAPLRSAIVS